MEVQEWMFCNVTLGRWGKLKRSNAGVMCLHFLVRRKRRLGEGGSQSRTIVLLCEVYSAAPPPQFFFVGKLKMPDIAFWGGLLKNYSPVHMGIFHLPFYEAEIRFSYNFFLVKHPNSSASLDTHKSLFLGVIFSVLLRQPNRR